MKKIILIVAVTCAVPLWSMENQVTPTGSAESDASSCSKISRSIVDLLCCLPRAAVSCVEKCDECCDTTDVIPTPTVNYDKNGMHGVY